MQLHNIHVIEAVLVCQTGLHIGAGDAEMHIGGIDNGVVKHPSTGVPYIPGSSIKGKMRSLLEWRSGAVQEGPLGWRDYEETKLDEVEAILKLFGVSGSEQLSVEQAEKIGPTRLSFWDALLEEDWRKSQSEAHRPFTEVKSENVINRISGEARHPRQTERVPSGARFRFKATLKDLGDEAELMDVLLVGMKLLEFDGLGGSTSRGYGKIRFEDLKIDGENADERLAAVRPFNRS